MLGDKINIKKINNKKIEPLISNILSILKKNKKITISIAGESGSGKSTLAFKLKKELNTINISSLVLQQDDYFFLTPKNNTKNRKKDLKNNVGPQEVNLKLLSLHNSFFLKNKNFLRPLIDYNNNTTIKEKIISKNYTILIIEGTYVSLIKNTHFKIFISLNYKDTFERRQKRGREKSEKYLEKILAIEHEIIKNHKKLADLII